MFYKDGLLSDEAVKILDEGRLRPLSKAFRRSVIDMEEEVFDGIRVKNVLHAAVT